MQKWCPFWAFRSQTSLVHLICVAIFCDRKLHCPFEWLLYESALAITSCQVIGSDCHHLVLAYVVPHIFGSSAAFSSYPGFSICKLRDLDEFPLPVQISRLTMWRVKQRSSPPTPRVSEILTSENSILLGYIRFANRPRISTGLEVNNGGRSSGKSKHTYFSVNEMSGNGQLGPPEHFCPKARNLLNSIASIG